MEFDVRKDLVGSVSKVVFADRISRGILDGKVQAHYLQQKMGAVSINDGHEFVLVESKEHAENLIKALTKVIDLGWLK